MSFQKYPSAPASLSAFLLSVVADTPEQLTARAALGRWEKRCVRPLVGAVILALCAGSAQAQTAHFAGAVAPNLGSAAVATSSPVTQTVTFGIDTSGTLPALSNANVLTQGASGLDFTLGTGSTCTGAVTAGQTCTVVVSFTPQYPGQRLGAVNLKNSSGTVLATALVYGTGTGPQVTFTPGAISTVAGNGTACSTSATTGCMDAGAATSAELSDPYGVAVDGAGNLYIADTSNHLILKVTAATGNISTVAGNGTYGYNGDSQTATSAELHNPEGVAVDGAGNLYIADQNNYRIRKVTAATGDISTVAGNGTYGYVASQDTGTTAATSAELYNPNGVAVDGAGNLYIADSFNHRIRKVTAATGYISTVAGNGTSCTTSATTGCMDGSAATSAELSYPHGVAVDGAGNLYIADTSNNRVRKVTAATGNISTVAGNGTAGYVASQDTGKTAATSAELSYPDGVVVDGAGNLYIADTSNNRVRKVTAATGYISTVAGNGTAGYSSDGIAATSSELNVPFGIALDGAGNLYLADGANNRIRKVTATAAPLAFASTAVGATSSDSPQTVIVNNIGNSLLTFANPTTGGNPSISAGFSIGNSSTCPQLTSGSSAGTLPPGASCTDLISFTPVTSGSVGGGLVTTGNALNVAGSTQSVTLSGTATADAFTVTGVSPSYGPAAGGTTVTVTGTGLNAVTRVTFGGVAATSFSLVSATTLTAVSPAGTGTVDIIVGSATDVSEPSTADQFSYVGTYTVTVNTDTTGGVAANCVPGGTSCSLRDAIAATNAAGFTGTTGAQPTINFAPGLSGQTITLNSPALNPTANVNIAGPGAGLLTIAATTSSTYSAFTSTTNSIAFTLSGVTVTGFGSIALSFSPTTATAAVADLITLNNDTLSNNGSSAVYVTYSTLAVTGSTFTGNSANAGGAVYATYAQGNPGVTITGSTFGTQAAPNRSLNHNLGGGAVYLSSSSATIGTSTFAYNTSTGSGGGVYVATNSLLTLNTDVFLNNASSGSGGAVYTDGSLTVAGSTFNNNTAVNGGGAICATQAISRFTVSGSSFMANQAGGAVSAYGGAIYITTDAVTSISNSNFLANRAVTTGGYAYGGALIAYGASLTNVLFSGNSTSSTNSSYGGAVDFSAGQLTGVTFTGNSTTGSATNSNGGAIYFSSSSGSTLKLFNTTISGNSAKTGGGLYEVTGGTLTLYNSVISGNSATTSSPDLYGTPSPTALSSDYGIAGSACSSSCMPMLSALGNYGGGTVGAPGYTTPVQVMLPLPGSPLLAAGSTTYLYNATTNPNVGTVTCNGVPTEPDARGCSYPRTLTEAGSTQVDIGAVEANYSLSFVQQPSNTVVGATVSPAPTVQLLESGVKGGDGVGTDQGSYAGGTLAITATPDAASTATVATTQSGLESLSESFSAGAMGETLTVAALSGAATPLTVASATSNVFTVAVPVPVVTGISTTTGPAAGGTSVTITGSLFTGITGVSFGGVAATGVVFNSDSSITATSPALAGRNAVVDVTVTTGGGTSATSSADQFTYVVPASFTLPTTAVGVSSGTQTAYVTFMTAGTLGTINVLTQGAVNKDYVFVSGGSCATNTAYTVGQVCTVNYTFTPSRPGQRLGAVSLTDSTGTVVLGTSFLIGTGTGPLATFPGSTAISSPGSTSGAFSNPAGMAVDGAGDVFVADINNSAVYEIVAVNGVVTSSSTVNTVGSGFYQPQGVAVDGSGDVFVADQGNSAVKEIVAVNGMVTSSSTVNTVGGGFSDPHGVAVDGSGDVFVADTYNSAVKEIVAVSGVVTSSSTVNTVGSGFYGPYGVAVDGSGDVFVADTFNNAVKEIVAVNGVVTSSSTLNTVGSGFSNPFGVTVDGSGDVFVADTLNNAVKEIVAVNGVVTSSSTVNPVGSGFSYPYGVAVDGNGHVFVADTGYSAVREVDLTAAPVLAFATTAVGATSSDSPHSVTLQNEGNAPLTFASFATGTTSFTLSGAGTCSTGTPLPESGVCTVAASFTPMQAGPLTDTLTLTDNSLNVAGATQGGGLSGTGVNLLPVVTGISPSNGPIAGGTTVTIAGSGFTGVTGVSFGGVPATGVVFNSDSSVTAVSPVLTGTNSVVDVTVTTGAGTSAPTSADQFTYTAADAYTAATEPVGTASSTLTAYVTITTAGTLGTISVLTQGATNLDFAYISGGTCTTAAAYAVGQICTVQYSFTPTQPYQRKGGVQLVDGAGNILGSVYLSGTGTGPEAQFSGGATTSIGTSFSTPFGAAVDGAGNVYVADLSSTSVQQIVAAGGYATVNSIGSGFSDPAGVAVDGLGNVFVGDFGNNAVKEIVAVGGSIPANPAILTIGSGFKYPTGLAVDASGNLYVADQGNNAVKELLAVNGSIPASSPTIMMLGSGFSGPADVAVDAAGDVFVADTYNSAVKEIAAGNGAITTLGSGYSYPFGIAVDGSGNVYVADTYHARVKKLLAVNGIVPATPTVVTLGTGLTGAYGLTLDTAGNVYVMDAPSHAVKKIDVIDAPALSFGQVTDDTSKTLSVQLTNAGNAALSGVSPYTSGLTSGAYAVLAGSGIPADCGSNLALTAGASCNISLAFTPAPGTTGTVNDSYALIDNNLNAASATQTLALSGTAALPPMITSISPTSGPVAGGTSVTISGSAFTGVTGVSFGATPAASFTFNADSSITAVSPQLAGPTPMVDITVTTANGSSALSAADQFTYIAPPSSTAPTSGVGVAETVTAYITITKAGTLASIAVLTQGASNSDFQLASGGSCTVGTAYNVGQVCSVVYTFTPTTPGERLGGIQLLDASSNILGSTFIHGAATGPRLIFAPGTTAAIGSGFSVPFGAAVDGAGNVYVADLSATSITEIVAAGGYTTTKTIGSGFNDPAGVAIDGLGNVYVGDFNNNAVKEIVAVGGSIPSTPTILTLGSGFKYPTGLAVDLNGNLYVADQGNSAVKELLAVNGSIPAANPTINVLGSGFNSPADVAVDAAGDVFVADTYNSAVKEIATGNGAITKLGTGYSYPFGIAVDGSGNVYVADTYHSAVKKLLAVNGVVPSTPTVLTLGTGLTGAYGLTLDGLGNVYVMDAPSHAVKKIDVVDTPAVNFGSVQDGTSLTLSVQLTNGGSAQLSGVAPFKSGPSTSSFAQVVGAGSPADCSNVLSLAPGATCNISLQFTPGASASGVLTDALAVTDNNLNAASATQTFALSGTAVQPSETITGGGTPVGTSSAPQSAMVSITTTGKLGAITVVTQGVQGLDFTPYTPASPAPTDCVTGNAYSVGQTCTVPYTFTPQHPGARHGGIALADAIGNTLGSVYLNATGSGSQSVYSPGVTTTLNSSFTVPIGAAVDAAGNVFVADLTTSSIEEVVAAGGYTTVKVLGSGFNSPQGVAIDGLGNLFVGDTNNAAVKEMLAVAGTVPANPTIVTLGSGLSYPNGVAVDGNGNVYVADQGNNAIKEIVAAGGYTTVNTLGSGFFRPTGVAVDSAGNVYVADTYNSAVKEITSGTSTVTTLGSGFDYPFGVAVDAFGDVFVADTYNGLVKELVAVSGSVPAHPTITNLGASSFSPLGLTLDGAGNVFVLDRSSGSVKKIDLADPPH